MLENINSPQDLKNLKLDEMNHLAKEIRQEIIKVVARNGGHLSSNLGVVDLTLALHKVFDSPQDAFIWDVGHQCYTHKLLTGRRASMQKIRQRVGASGFPKPSESEHDIFEVGHASTSISSALGLLVAKQIKNEKDRVVAIIGDGALTGGMAFEALSNAGHLGLPLIVVLNDNRMSISANVGALSLHLSHLTTTMGYQKFRSWFDRSFQKIPVIGKSVHPIIVRIKSALKALIYKENLFSQLGFEYVGPVDGHNIKLMLEIFRAVRELRRPVVVHVVTQKGRGYDVAEADPVSYHGMAPVTIVDGKVEKAKVISYTDSFSQAMLKLGHADEKIVAITAAMAKGTGLDNFRVTFPKRFYDVGIAEQHAVTFAAGLARGGLKPIVAIYSTFMQRAVDQVIHDVALSKLPVIFALDRAGAVGSDGPTHQGIYDLAIFKTIPGMTIIAPASAQELQGALSFALELGAPVMIRYPKMQCPKEESAYSAEFKHGQGVFLRREQAKTLVITLGASVSSIVQISDNLVREGLYIDVYNLRFASPIDRTSLINNLHNYTNVVVVEEAIASGGIGESIAKIITEDKIAINFVHYAFPLENFPHGDRDEILSDASLDQSSLEYKLRALASPSNNIIQFPQTGV